MTPWMKWLLRARPADYALALSVAGASLPVVGKHLEPLGGVTAMGVWGARMAPQALSTMTKDWLTPGSYGARRRDTESARDVSVAALRGVVSSADLDAEWPAADPTPPIWDALRQRRYVYRRGVHYGDHPAQLLDVWRRKDLPTGPAPVLIFVPGGAEASLANFFENAVLAKRHLSNKRIGWRRLVCHIPAVPWAIVCGIGSYG